MKAELLVHDFERRCQRIIERIKRSPEITKKDKQAILGFLHNARANGIGTPRILKYGYHLFHLARWTNSDLVSLRKPELETMVADIEAKPYSEWTKHDYKVAIRRFFLWLKGGEDYPNEVRWISTTVRSYDKKLPEEILTEDEVVRVIEAAHHPRGKAFVATLYESGCRIGEVLSLRIRNVQFDKYGTVLLVNGKTGSRRIRIISATGYLTTWLNSYPGVSEPLSPLWPKIGGDRTDPKYSHLTYRGAAQLISRIAHAAGIKKRVHPHLFRHSRATHLARHLTEAQMKEFFGWAQGSDMAALYVHLSGRDVDKALLRMYGIAPDPEDKPSSSVDPRKCSRCSSINTPTAKFCCTCSLVLDPKTAVELGDRRQKADDLLTDLVKDPEVLQLLIRKITEKGLGNQLKEIVS